MVSSVEMRESRLSGKHQKIAWLLLAALLFLRLPFLGGIGYLVETRPDWLDPTFQIGTYLLTAVLIWWERERLVHFHLDGLAVAIIILFKPFQTLLLGISAIQKVPLAFPSYLSFALWAIALGLSFALLFSQAHLPSIHSSSFRLLVLGLLAGIAMAVVMSYPMSFQVDPRRVGLPLPWPQVFASVIWSYPYQLGYAAVTEEPLFRGFLWGYLRDAGWKDLWI